MASRNKVFIMGRLGQDPEIRHTVAGLTVGHMSVATNETWTDSKGAKQVRTEWHRVVLFGPHAENAVKYLKKGSMVDVEGRLQTSKWTDNNGVDRYTTEIIASSVQYLSPAQA